MNLDIANTLIARLMDKGIKDFVVCAGARNAPLVVMLDKCCQQNEIQVHHFFEERSAGFFALGLSKRNLRPTAVLTTSGTAAAELLPVAVEAYYSQTPLVFVTADRPRIFRKTGAPQSIEQVGLYSVYSKASYDIDSLSDLNGERGQIDLSGDGVTHINVCFSEPLLDSDKKVAIFGTSNDRESRSPIPTAISVEDKIKSFFDVSRRPLVILSAIPKELTSGVIEFLNSFEAPVWIESQSQLRENPKLKGLRISAGEFTMTASAFDKDFDSVLRIGSIPTLRIWRDLDLSLSHIPVLNVDDAPFSGLAREESRPVSFLEFAQNSTSESRPRGDDLVERDFKKALSFENILANFSNSEPGMIRQLSERISPNSFVFLGNSLPIREWDLIATRVNKNFEVFANRGANGIDGILSTFLGMARPDVENWLVLGDLSALYDLNALAFLNPNRQTNIRIVVVNNKGGQIFRRMFQSKSFINEHSVQFLHWAQMFGLDYHLVQDGDWPDFEKLNKATVIELQPQNERTDSFWRELEQKESL